MFRPGLSMLWERTDPGLALQQRFGFADLVAMSTWLTDALRQRWSLRVREVERILLSDRNAVCWVHTVQGSFVVKVCADPARFTRLGRIADVVTHLGEVGVPVPEPRPALDGGARVVIGGPPVPQTPPVRDDDVRASVPHSPPAAPADSGGPGLSVIVQPLMPGAMLDVGDLAGVRAAGATLARVHLAVVDLPHAGHRVRAPDLHHRLGQVLPRGVRNRVPHAATLLDQLLADLPVLTTPTQLVHHDFRGTNVLMDGPEVSAVLDFDEMSVGHPVLDLALAATMLATGFTTWDPAPPQARAALVAGYRSVRDLSDLEQEWLAAMLLALGMSQIADGRNPQGWIRSVQQLAARQ